MLRPMSFLTLVLFLALAGCTVGTESQSLQAAAGGTAALAAQLPPLPAPRTVSVMMEYTQLGTAAVMRAVNSVEEATSLRLAGLPGQAGWAIWGFGLADNPVSCRVDFSGEAGSEAYFAVSDYNRGTWEILGPLPGPQQILNLNSPDYSNEAGEVFIAVFAYDTASILVDQLVLVSDVNPVRQTIDPCGGYTSLAMVGGYPAISFFDESTDDLRYVRAGHLFGASWSAPVTVDSTGETGLHSSLEVVDGNPAIAYYCMSDTSLLYVRALDSAGTMWGMPVTVDNSTDTGEYCSLAVVDGNPAISYHDFDGGQLMYVRAGDSTGSLWGMPVIVDTDGNTGQYTSLLVVDGNPAISYRNGGAAELKYARANDATGSAWGTPLMLDDEGSAGFHTSMAIVNGAPAIAYYDGSMGDLQYIRALDAVGSSWGVPLMLDGAEDEGSFCSLAVIGSGPAISCHGGLQGDLRYYYALDSNGDSWASATIIDDSSVLTGKYTSLCNVYGTPAISYYDQTNGMLRFAWGLGAG